MDEFPFFVYDHSAVVQEGDDLMDAIMFYHPKATPLDSQCALCGQLMGMVRCLQVISGAAPSVYHLQKCKIAVRHAGRFTVALGASPDLPNAAVVKQLDSLCRIFAFYHGSLDTVLKRCGEKQPFLLAMEQIWECYLPYVKHYSRVVPAIFDVIPSVPLPKSAGVLYLRASHILQSCQRKPGVLAGCLLYDSKVLCTQLSPELTSKLLLIRANQNNHPANEVETNFSLPFGVRILSVYLTKREHRSFSNHSQKLFPTRQRHTAVSSFQSSRGERRVNRTATEGGGTLLAEHSPLRGVGDGCEAEGESSKEQSFVTPPFRLPDSIMDKEDKLSTRSSFASDDLGGEALSTEVGIDPIVPGHEGTSSASSRRDSVTSGKSGSNTGVLESYEGAVSLSSAELADEREHGGIDEDTSVLVLKVEEPDLPVSQVETSPGDDSEVRSPDIQLPEIQTSGGSNNVFSHVEQDRVSSSEESRHSPVSKERTNSPKREQETNNEESSSEKMSSTHSNVGKDNAEEPTLSITTMNTDSVVSHTEVETAQDLDLAPEKTAGVCKREPDSSEDTVSKDSCQDVANQESQDKSPRSEKCSVTDSKEVPSEVDEEDMDDISNRTVPAPESKCSDNVANNENAQYTNSSHSHTSTANKVEYSPVKDTSGDVGASEELCMEGLDDVANLKHADSLQNTQADTSQGICNGQLESDDITGQSSEKNNENTASIDDRDVSALRSTDVTTTLPNLTPETANSSTVGHDSAEVMGSNEVDDPRSVDSLHISQPSVSQALATNATVEENSPEGVTDANDALEGEDNVPQRKSSSADCRLPGLVNAGLYVQGHSHMVLLMLMERNIQNDLPTMQGLWKTSVTQMGELEGQLKDVVFPVSTGASEEGYNFLHFDGFDRLLKGNMQEPVLAPDVAFCNSAQFIHQQFQQSDTLNDVLFRSQSTGVYGSRSLSQETFFQLRGPGRGGQQGVPSPHDPLFNLENRARKKLFKDHRITFF